MVAATVLPKKRGRPRQDAAPIPTSPGLDFTAPAWRKPTLTSAEVFALLGGVPGFTSKRVIQRRAQLGTLPGYVRPVGSRGYVLTSLLLAHLTGHEVQA